MEVSERTRRGMPAADISGERFHRLVALHPTEQRDSKGYVVWHCRCDCGTELDVSYNELKYTNLRSCGCMKREHEAKLNSYLTNIDGASLSLLKSSRIPSNNSTGCKGVYLVNGKYRARIVFQKKAYYLGVYDKYEEAVAARRAAETMLQEETEGYYLRWKEKAAADEAWARENPIKIFVSKDDERGISVSFYPVL